MNCHQNWFNLESDVWLVLGLAVSLLGAVFQTVCFDAIVVFCYRWGAAAQRPLWPVQPEVRGQLKEGGTRKGVLPASVTISPKVTFAPKGRKVTQGSQLSAKCADFLKAWNCIAMEKESASYQPNLRIFLWSIKLCCHEKRIVSYQQNLWSSLQLCFHEKRNQAINSQICGSPQSMQLQLHEKIIHLSQEGLGGGGGLQALYV